MTKKESAYTQAVSRLREDHADKIEAIFLEMYKIATGDGSEDKDRVNAAKVCASILGVPKPPTEKPSAKPTGETDSSKPALSDKHKAALDELLK